MKPHTRRKFIQSIAPSAILIPAAFASAAALKKKTAKPETKIKTFQHQGMKIYSLLLGHLSVNCYIVADLQNNCIVIDPGAEAEVILSFIKKHKFTVKAWLLSHSHLDHISALDECYTAIPAPVAMHPEENDWAFCDKNQWDPYYPLTKEVPIERELKHWQKFTDGSLEYTVLHSPGHSAGSVCFWFPKQKVIFSGDTLFAGTVGRTDLHKSSFKSLIRSLGIFLALPPETVIYPGHGEITTVKKEIETNPFFKHTPDKKKDDN